MATTKQELCEEFLDLFLREHISRPGPGFYMQDAYRIYQNWMLEKQQTRFVLGRNKFGLLLEVRSYERSSRKGVMFFKDASLKGGRRVYCVWGGEKPESKF